MPKDDITETSKENQLDPEYSTKNSYTKLPSWLIPPLPDFILTGITIFIIMAKLPISFKTKILLVSGILLLRMGMGILRARYDTQFHRPFSWAVMGIAIAILVFTAFNRDNI